MIVNWIREILGAWRAWQGRTSNATDADIEAVDREWQRIDRLGEDEIEAIRRLSCKRQPTTRIDLRQTGLEEIRRDKLRGQSNEL